MGTRSDFDRQTLQRDVAAREKVLRLFQGKAVGERSGGDEWSGCVSGEGLPWEMLGENLEG